MIIQNVKSSLQNCLHHMTKKSRKHVLSKKKMIFRVNIHYFHSTKNNSETLKM